MSVKIYVIEDGLAMSYMTSINSFRQFLSTDTILDFKGPKVFETVAEAERYCESLNPDPTFEDEPYKWPLRSYDPTDVPFIEAIDSAFANILPKMG